MSATITKSELIDLVSHALSLPTSKTEQLVDTVLDAMIEAMCRGERVEIRGFGTFTVRDYKAHEGRNPRTGEPLHVAAKRMPFFKTGTDLRNRINRAVNPNDVDPSDE